MRIEVDSTYRTIDFENGDSWKLDRYNFYQILETILSPSQLSTIYDRDFVGNVSGIRLKKAKEIYESL